MAAIFDDEQIKAAAREAADQLGFPRCAFILGAIALPTIAYADPATRDEYVGEVYFKYIFPQRGDGSFDATDTQIKQAYAMAAVQWTCGMTTERIWRGAGVAAPVIYDFYADRVAKGQYAVMIEKQIAEKEGCWVSGAPWVEGTPLPLPGDALIIGCKSCGDGWSRNTTNEEHEFTAVAFGDDGIVYSVDGGQPGIAFRTRRLLEVWTGTNAQGQRTGELWAGTVDKNGVTATDSSGRPVTGRRVIGFTNVAGLPLDGSATPCGGGLSSILGGGSTTSKIVRGAAAVAVGVGAALAARSSWGMLRRQAGRGGRRGLSA